MDDADRQELRREFRRLSLRGQLSGDRAMLAAANRIFETLYGSAEQDDDDDDNGFDGAVIALLVEGDETVEYDDGDSAPLHCTIAFLGGAADLDDAQRVSIDTVCRTIAEFIDPFEAHVVSAAEFGETPVWIIEHEDVQAARMIADEDPDVGGLRDAHDEHPTFLPHVSGLGDRDTVRFDRVAAMLGGEITEYPLGVPSTLQTQTPDLDANQSQGVLT
jgi:hypothetical protein